MALWHYSFQLLPKSTAVSEGDIFLNREITTNLDFWHNYQISKSDISEIQAVLLPARSWNNDLLIFGNANESHIQFIIDKGFVLEAELRVDLRSEFSSFLRKISCIRFLQNVFLLDESGYVLTISSSLIISRIIKSEHYIKFKHFYS